MGFPPAPVFEQYITSSPIPQGVHPVEMGKGVFLKKLRSNTVFSQIFNSPSA
jgi:hypothetical protein